MMAFLMGLKSLTPAAVHELSKRGALTLIDVNSRRSFELAHVPGALHRDPARLVESDLPAAKDASLVFYCSNPMCRKAPTAARRAKQWGYLDAKVMAAGISGWVAAGLPTESGRNAAADR